MGKESRWNTVAMERMLPVVAVPLVANFALQETLIEDSVNQVTSAGWITDAERRRAINIIDRQKRDLAQINGIFKGRVPEAVIPNCELFMCGAQDAMDSFFDRITPEDIAAMEATKARWPKGGGDAERSQRDV